MLSSILLTKLFMPSMRPARVLRPRLVERLDEGLHRRLTLISAPAGFGKTTLVSEWLDGVWEEDSERDAGVDGVAWLSLDEGDNDLTRFLTYFVAALQRIDGIDEAFGRGAWAMLQSAQFPGAGSILTSLINELAACDARIIFVLDDYHLIDAQAVHDALGFVLENLPSQLHLVIATRVDPHLPLSRLRARDQMTELRAADLRFTTSEAAEFLNRVMGLNLSADDIAALEGRTEGWIAGLLLAAISLQGRPDKSGLIQSFTGSHRLVLDFLIEEVLGQQPDSVQAFLLQTAMLDRLNGALCDALTGQDHGQATLEMLERANLFIVPLDEERRWYRYHHLFADLLRQRLQQTLSHLLPDLHRRASLWYEQQGFVDEAIEHSLQVEDNARAAQLISEHFATSWGRGEQRKLQRWLAALPAAMLASRPFLGILHARYLCTSGRLHEAEQVLQAAEQTLAGGNGDVVEGGAGAEQQDPSNGARRLQLRGRIAAARALMCSYQGDVPGIIHHAKRALSDLPVEDLTWRGVTALTLGNAQGFLGNMAAAYEARMTALEACEAAGDLYFILVANMELAITLRAQGRLQRTIAICQEQWRFAHENGLAQTRTVGWLLAVWGETSAELNDLEGAVDRAQRGFALAERSGDLQMIGWSFMCLFRVLFSSGDLAGAGNLVQYMEAIARKSNLPPWITSQMAAWQARLWLAQYDLNAATQWVRKRGFATGERFVPLEELGFFTLPDYILLVRILIAQERLDEAIQLAQHLGEAAASGGRMPKMVEILNLQALALYARGDAEGAVHSLSRALDLAAPEGLIRIFVDEGPAMGRLLYEALSQEIAPQYVRRLLDAFSPFEVEASKANRSHELEFEYVEPLSEREIEVLQLVAEGLSNRDIAARLYLSLNTVKVHTRHIYGKLGVNSRMAAVARARALGVLPLGR